MTAVGYRIKKSASSRQDFHKFVTNVSQLIEYGDFYKIISAPIKCILEELLSLGLLLSSGNKMSKNCKFQSAPPQLAFQETV